MENFKLEDILKQHDNTYSGISIFLNLPSGETKREILKTLLWSPLCNLQNKQARAAAYFINNIANNQIYIGSTSNIFRRLGYHRNKLVSNTHSNVNLQNGFHVNLKGFIDVCVIFANDREDAYDIEQMLLDSFKDDKRLTNIAINARKTNLGIPWEQERKDYISRINTGRIVSKETREKISKAHIGKIRSEEIRKKLSIAFKGRKLSKEHILLISERTKGRKATLETKLKQSIAQKGKKVSPEGRANMHIASRALQKPITINGTHYDSILIASKTLHIPTSTIGIRLRSEKEPYKDWKYANEDKLS
jgi:group I intron endonuclease